LSLLSLFKITKTEKLNIPLFRPSAARPSYLKTRRFPPPSHEWFGFLGIYLHLTLFNNSNFDTKILPFNNILQIFNLFNLL